MTGLPPPSSPLSSPPVNTTDFSPVRQSGEVTPNTTPNDPAVAADSTLVKEEFVSPPNLELDTKADVEEDTPAKKRKIGQSTSTNADDKLYPAGLPRLTRFGKGTYGINTGPLGDDTDWDSLSVQAIREQLKMRGVESNGTKAVILDRIKNWKEYVPGDELAPLNLTQEPAFEYNPDKLGAASAPGRGLKWKSGANEATVAASVKALAETMYLIQRDDLDWGDEMNNGMAERATFTILTSTQNMYHVVVGQRCSCDCPAKKFKPHAHCKHILYVLIQILRAPEVLIQQQGFVSTEVHMLLTHGPKLRPSQADINADPTMKDGVPKEKTAHDCAFCFRPMDGGQTACCDKCGRQVHNNCFAIWASRSTWNLTCLICKSKWNQEIPKLIEELKVGRKKRAPKAKANDEDESGW